MIPNTVNFFVYYLAQLCGGGHAFFLLVTPTVQSFASETDICL